MAVENFPYMLGTLFQNFLTVLFNFFLDSSVDELFNPENAHKLLFLSHKKVPKKTTNLKLQEEKITPTSPSGIVKKPKENQLTSSTN